MKKTYSDVAAHLGRQKEKYEGMLDSSDQATRNTAQRMLDRIDMRMDELFAMQESSKMEGAPATPDGPMMADGGPLFGDGVGFSNTVSLGNAPDSRGLSGLWNNGQINWDTNNIMTAAPAVMGFINYLNNRNAIKNLTPPPKPLDTPKVRLDKHLDVSADRARIKRDKRSIALAANQRTTRNAADALRTSAFIRGLEADNKLTQQQTNYRKGLTTQEAAMNNRVDMLNTQALNNWLATTNQFENNRRVGLSNNTGDFLTKLSLVAKDFQTNSLERERLDIMKNAYAPGLLDRAMNNTGNNNNNINTPNDRSESGTPDGKNSSGVKDYQSMIVWDPTKTKEQILAPLIAAGATQAEAEAAYDAAKAATQAQLEQETENAQGRLQGDFLGQLQPREINQIPTQRTLPGRMGPRTAPWSGPQPEYGLGQTPDFLTPRATQPSAPVATREPDVNRITDQEYPMGNPGARPTLSETEIMESEGFREDPYYATELEKQQGIVTRGYGETIRLKPGQTIDDIPSVTEEEARQRMQGKILESDIEIAAVEKAAGIDLTPNQEAALASLLYNIGVGETWRNSKARKALYEGDLDTFIKEAFDPVNGFVKEEPGMDPLPGLVARRKRELELWNS